MYQLNLMADSISNILVILYLPLIYLFCLLLIYITSSQALPTKVSVVDYVNLDEQKIKTDHSKLLSRLSEVKQLINTANNIKNQKAITVETLTIKLKVLTG